MTKFRLLQRSTRPGLVRATILLVACLILPSESVAQKGYLATLRASDQTSNDRFAHSVAVSGEWIVSGALYEDSRGADSGAAYVMRNVGGNWVEFAKLNGSDTTTRDEFGTAVDVSGDRIIVGADKKNGLVALAGAAYVFEWDGAAWTETAKLVPSSPNASDRAGLHVAIDGDVAVVGMQGADTARRGRAYVFEKIARNWIETAVLEQYPGGQWDHFGSSVDVDGDRIIVGARTDNWAKTAAGAATIFVRNGQNWEKEAFLTASDAEAGDWFGTSVSIDGATAAVGASYSDPHGRNSGSVYVFSRTGTTWTEDTKLTASNGDTHRYFGEHIDLEGDLLLVGTDGDGPLAPPDIKGIVPTNAYIFQFSDGSWTEEAVLESAPKNAADSYGYAVSLDATSIVVGAPRNRGLPEGAENSGSAFIYDRKTVVSNETVNEFSELPSAVSLEQNYPNPFNPETTIRFSLLSSEHVELDVFDATGRKIRQLASGVRSAGEYEVRFDAAGLTTGIYFYRLRAGAVTHTRAMTILQ